MGTVTRAIEELRSRGIGGIVCAAGERINEDLSRELFLLFVNPHLYGLVCHFAEGRRVYDENGNGTGPIGPMPEQATLGIGRTPFQTREGLNL